MSSDHQPKSDSLLRVAAIFPLFSFLALALCCGISGCSEAPVKERTEEKKKVVQEMNIQNPDGGSATSEQSEAKKEPGDEIESLPFDEPSSETKEKEKELPMLGTEG